MAPKLALANYVPPPTSKIIYDMKFNINLVCNDRLKFAFPSRLFIYDYLYENNMRDYDTLQMLLH